MGKECSQKGPKPEETLLTAASRRMKSAPIWRVMSIRKGTTVVSVLLGFLSTL